MRAGMDRDTGRLLTGWAHCAQSITVILTTEIGTRVMRRAFGSDVHAMQDRNPDGRTIMVGFVAIAAALRRWEPGFKLLKIEPESISAEGTAVFKLSGIFYPNGHLGDFMLSEPRTLALENSTRNGWKRVA